MIEPILIENPLGIDLVIQDFQVYLQNNLPEIEKVFGRCYKTETKDGFIPEVYIGKKEYYEIMSDDTIASHCFFDVEDTENIEYGSNSYLYTKNATVRLIVMAKLDDIYNFSHRSDEDLINAIENKIDSYSSVYSEWKYSRILKKTANVFSNYSYKLDDNLNDMQPFFVCAFEFDVSYSSKFKCNN